LGVQRLGREPYHMAVFSDVFLNSRPLKKGPIGDPEITTRGVINQQSAVLIYFAAEDSNHAC
jgi:hypothetical protein